MTSTTIYTFARIRLIDPSRASPLHGTELDVATAPRTLLDRAVAVFLYCLICGFFAVIITLGITGGL